MQVGTDFRVGELITARGFTSVSQFVRWLKRSHIRVSQPHINNIRNNNPKAKNVGLQTLAQIGGGLHVPVWALFADAPPYPVAPFTEHDRVTLMQGSSNGTANGNGSTSGLPIPSPRFRIRTYVKRRGTTIGQLWTDQLQLLGQHQHERELLSLGYFYTVASNDAPNVGLRRLEDIARALQVPIWALFADAPPYAGVSPDTLDEDDARAVTVQLSLPELLQA